MISEAGYSTGKLISLFKLIDKDNFEIGGFACEFQGFLIVSSELSSFLWIIYIAFSFLKLLKYHQIQTSHKLQIFCLYLFPILISAILGILSQLGSSNESQSIWCWIKIHPGLGDNTPMYILYMLYLAFIVTNVVIYFKIHQFLKHLAIVKGPTPTILSQVTRYLKRTSLICIVLYSIAFTNRIIQISSLSNENLVLFTIYAIHIPLLNSKGSLFFLFCLEKTYREHLTDFLFSKHNDRNSNTLEDNLQSCCDGEINKNNNAVLTTTATIESSIYKGATFRETINN